MEATLERIPVAGDFRRSAAVTGGGIIPLTGPDCRTIGLPSMIVLPRVAWYLRPVMPCRIWVALALQLSLIAVGPAVVAPGICSVAAAADGVLRSSPAAKASYTAAAALQNRAAWDLAADAWEELLRVHPRDPLAAKARYYLGLCRVEEGKWPDAQQAFAAVIESNTADADTVLLARWELGRGRFAAAQASRQAEAYREAVLALRGYLDSTTMPPQAAEASYLLGEALWLSGERQAAVDVWQRFITEQAESPRLAEVLYALGVAQAEDGRDKDAAATLRRFAETFPDHLLAGEVAIRRADLALAADQPAEAAQLVVGMAQDGKSPQAADALERLGTALWHQKRYQAAAAAFDLLVARDPAAPKVSAALLSASAAWAAAGKPDEARKRLTQIVASAVDSSDGVEASARLARLELLAGDPDAALVAAEGGLDKAAPGGRLKDTVDAGIVARLRLVRAEALLDLPGQRDACIAALATLLAEHPSDNVVAEALALQAAVLMESGKVAEALVAADRYLALDDQQRSEQQPKTSFDVRAIRAEAILAGGDPVAAVAAWRGLVDDAQTDALGDTRIPHWILRLGAAEVAAETWAAAHATLAPLASAPPGTSGLDSTDLPESLFLDATALVELARPQEALLLLDRIDRDHATSSRHPEALLLAVRARRGAGDVAGALEIAERVVGGIAGGPLAERAWFRLGIARQDAGKQADAVAAFLEARRIAPDGPRVAAGLLAEGWSREALEDLAGAGACWSEVIDRFPESASLVQALLARGDVRQRSGDFAAGLADAERVMRLAAAADGRATDEADAEARLLAGICHSSAGRTAEAIATFQAELTAHPDFPATDRVLLELGMAQSTAGDSAAAEATFAELRRRFPGSPRLAEGVLEIGEMRFAAADWIGAAEAYTDLLALSQSDEATGAILAEQARHKFAWTLAMRQDPKAAAEAFREQLATSPEGACAADGRVMLGDALCRLGRFDEASAVLACALAAPAGISSADLLGLATVRAAECAAKEEHWQESHDLVASWLAARQSTGTSEDGAEPAAATVAQARFARAWALQNLSRFDEALTEYRTLADDGLGTEAASRGPTELAARARLMEGEVLFEQERHKEAIAAFFKVAYGFGDRQAPAAFHPWQAQAIFEAARCFEVLGKPVQARGLYAELRERHPQSPHDEAARKRLDSLTPAAK